MSCWAAAPRARCESDAKEKRQSIPPAQPPLSSLSGGAECEIEHVCCSAGIVRIYDFLRTQPGTAAAPSPRPQACHPRTSQSGRWLATDGPIVVCGAGCAHLFVHSGSRKREFGAKGAAAQGAQGPAASVCGAAEASAAPDQVVMPDVQALSLIHFVCCHALYSSSFDTATAPRLLMMGSARRS